MADEPLPRYVGVWTSPSGLVVEVSALITTRIIIRGELPPSERSWFTDDVVPQIAAIVRQWPTQLSGWREIEEEDT